MFIFAITVVLGLQLKFPKDFAAAVLPQWNIRVIL